MYILIVWKEDVYVAIERRRNKKKRITGCGS